VRVLLVNSTSRDAQAVELKNLKQDLWTETTADFGADFRRNDGGSRKPESGDRFDELHFLLPRGAELLLDEVLLYEPGK
jgi:hypothetical protein